MNYMETGKSNEPFVVAIRLFKAGEEKCFKSVTNNLMISWKHN